MNIAFKEEFDWKTVIGMLWSDDILKVFPKRDVRGIQFYLTFQLGRERISEYSSSAESRYVPVTPKGMWWVGSKKEKARAGGAMRTDESDFRR